MHASEPGQGSRKLLRLGTARQPYVWLLGHGIRGLLLVQLLVTVFNWKEVLIKVLLKAHLCRFASFRGVPRPISPSQACHMYVGYP